MALRGIAGWWCMQAASMPHEGRAEKREINLTTPFSRHCLHAVRIRQIPLDALFARLSAVTAGEVRAVEAMERLSRSPHRGWAAIVPVTKRRLTLDVGERPLALAPGGVHHVAPVLAPGGVP
jgi:hypothetical protein